MNRLVLPLLLFLLSSVCVLQIAAVDQEAPVQDVISDFQDLIPLEKLYALLAHYMVNDAQFRQTLQYMGSVEFYRTWDRFFKLDTVQELLQYLAESGIPAKQLLNMFSDITDAIRPRVRRDADTGKVGFRAFIEDCIKLISASHRAQTHEERKRLNRKYKKMAESLATPECKQLVLQVFRDPEVVSIQKVLLPHDIDMKQLWRLFTSFLVDSEEPKKVSS